MKVKMISIVIGVLGTNLQKIGKGTGRLGDKRTSEDYPNYSIIKISQNTQRSPGDLRRLAKK